MAKITSSIPLLGGVKIHNDLNGLNDGDYKHLTVLEKTKFDSIPDNFALVATSNDYNDLDNLPTIPTPLVNHSELNLDDGSNPHGTTASDVGAYTTTETDNLLNLKKDKRYEIEYEDNFYSNSATFGSTFAPVIVNGGAVLPQIFTSGIFTPPSFDSTTGNLLRLSTGVNAVGLASITLGSQNDPGTFFPGQGEYMMETKVTFPALSTVSESFMYMFGFHSTGNIVSNNVISFKYDPERIFGFGAGPISANLLACTTQSTNRTFTDTGVTVNINQWYWLKIIINPTASEVRFYINNVLVATHTTNITLTGKHLTNVIRKNAGTTARVAQLRYMYFGHTPTNPIR
jgi:hypothetical protein